MFRIERVLKRKNQVFVKWKGYNDAFNSWVPLTDISNLFNSQEALGHISPLTAIEKFTDVRNRKI